MRAGDTWGNIGPGLGQALAALMAEVVLSVVANSMHRQEFAPEVVEAVVDRARRDLREECDLPPVACELKCLRPEAEP